MEAELNKAVLAALQRIEQRLERLEQLLQPDVDDEPGTDLDGLPNGRAREPGTPL